MGRKTFYKGYTEVTEHGQTYKVVPITKPDSNVCQTRTLAQDILDGVQAFMEYLANKDIYDFGKEKKNETN